MIKILLSFASACTIASAAEVQLSNPKGFTGLCDASAGVALNSDYFVVADDESNYLRTYSYSRPGAQVRSLNLDSFLQVDKKNPEADIEGAAQLGSMVFWITSHGQNKGGKERESRERLFTTKAGSGGEIVPAGVPYKNLVSDLTRAPDLLRYNFRSAAGKAPKKKDALNIEALAVGPGDSLLIGFRNPIPQGRALIIPLLNPVELVTEGNLSKAEFGMPVELDLGGQGIRALLGSPGKYYILAGEYDSTQRSTIWEWDGKEVLNKIWTAESAAVNLEALFELPGEGAPRIVALSDDGTRQIGGKDCKKLPASLRTFRSFDLVIGRD